MRRDHRSVVASMTNRWRTLVLPAEGRSDLRLTVYPAVRGSASEDRLKVLASWRRRRRRPGGSGSRPASAGRTEGAVRPDALTQPALTRAVQITRFGDPEVLDVVDLPDPSPGDVQQLYEVGAAGVDSADTHHRLAVN